jgi:hypothetical protein
MKRPALEDPTSSALPEVALSDIVSECEVRLASDVVIGRPNGFGTIQKWTTRERRQ